MGNRQARQLRRVDLTPEFYRLDVHGLGWVGKRSNKENREESGLVEATLVGNVIKLTAKKLESGKVDSVALPHGKFTYHTHPRECPDLDDCSLLPPSADDMKIFAQRKNTQAVMSKDFTYIVRLRPEYQNAGPEEFDAILKFFTVFEKHFDDLKKGGHKDYEYLWNNAVVWSNWFDIIRFDNQNCLHSFRSDQVYSIIPDHLISLAAVS